MVRVLDSGKLLMCKMFWHVPGMSAASPADTILDKDNFKLEDLLDEDEIIQECKALNTRLINLTNLVGPVVKFLLLIAAIAILIIWLIIGIPGSILARLVYGFLAPIMATFGAVGEGKEKTFVHCFVDGIWSTITRSYTIVRDAPPDEKPYEIRLLDIPAALLSAACGHILDGIMFTLIAIYKFPVMLFKGWKRLIQDMIGREGPFLETACVPLVGLAILLWPFAVVGAVLASILSSISLGAYGVVSNCN